MHTQDIDNSKQNRGLDYMSQGCKVYNIVDGRRLLKNFQYQVDIDDMAHLLLHTSTCREDNQDILHPPYMFPYYMGSYPQLACILKIHPKHGFAPAHHL